MFTNMNLQYRQKQSLQLSLKLWLPLLQAPLHDLEQIFKEHSYDNPFLDCKSSFESHKSSGSSYAKGTGDKQGFIENTNINQESLYDKVSNQLGAPLFPTPKSQNIADEILFYINNEGYFEGDIEKIAIKHKTTNEFVESIRKRFAHIEPCGIGAVDLQESFLFQLSNLEVDEDLCRFTKQLILNMKKIDKFHEHHLFERAKETIKKFNSPPAIEYMNGSEAIIPDFFVEIDDDIKIKINSNYYPDIVVTDPFKSKNIELKDKLKEARDLVNLLELRKSTLYKLILIIVEKQMSFFIGSELKPLTMAQVADELGFDESTISRAVSNKYIKCKRGVLSLKSLFTNAVSSGISSAEIKSYISNVIKNESNDKPLTDQDLVDMVMKRYNMKMVRRTITKYRKILDIPSSKERKKIYRVS
ncbi:RNA polymerase factor sigma-54 [Sulfurospirillum arcachonense]|uniref:RNA polymerase factor sigma-54 n=1 Tax=Sulfurospirillum arcachonense TaxID=57666 RepID=UPI000468CBAB|nr:RNA polymerase factor sigma-54 [Sulfurospirillum arcachonense]